MYCSFGERVTVFRKRNNYTKKRLAELTGISSSTLTMYERDMAVPNAEHVIKLAIALNVSIDDLVCITDSKDKDKNNQEKDTPKITRKQLLKNCRKLLEHTGNLH